MTPILLAVAVTLAAPAAKDKEPKKDPPSLVGEWACESAVEKGRPINLPPGTAWTFTADGKGRPINLPPGTAWTFTADGKSVLTLGDGGPPPAAGTYKADATKAPAEVDVSDGPKGKPLRAIFKVEGDTLTVCLVEGDAVRPTAFESPAGSKVILLTLKRVKKKE